MQRRSFFAVVGGLFGGFFFPQKKAEAQSGGDRELIEYLWQIIDDIDTVDDAAKSNDEWYRKAVRRLQAKRWETGITSDGYTLDFSMAKAPNLANDV